MIRLRSFSFRSSREPILAIFPKVFAGMTRITMKGLVRTVSSFLMIAVVSTQYCPNNIAVYNPNAKTSCNNGSMAIPSPYPASLRISDWTETSPTQHISSYPYPPPQSRAPSRPTNSYLSQRPTKRSSRTAFQPGCGPCSSSSTSKTTSAVESCRRRIYWAAASRYRT